MRIIRTLLLIPAFALPCLAQTGSLSGYVRDEASLRGVGGVEVTIDGVDRKTRTDKDGKYSLRDVPVGPQKVHVRILGFAPIDTVLEFIGGKNIENVFFLAKPPVRLDSVVSTARPRDGAGFETFEVRRARGFGSFLDSTFLRANEQRHLPDVLNAGMKGLDVVTPTTCKLARPIYCNWRVAAKRGPSQMFCAYQVVLDGTVVQRAEEFDDRDAPPFSPPAVIQSVADAKALKWGKLFDLNSVSVGSLVGVEVYRSGAEAPDVYGGAGTSCGVLVLWTRR
jgi:hypothetical protein